MSALHWEALRKQRVVDKKHEWEQKYKTVFTYSKKILRDCGTGISLLGYCEVWTPNPQCGAGDKIGGAVALSVIITDFIDLRHFIDKYEELKKLIEQHRKEFEAGSQNPNDSSYEKQLNALLGRNGMCPRGQYHRSIDEERRRQIQEAAIKDFSAKMSRRYNDTDFAQLW